MMVIGLTGPTGAGKGAVSALFLEAYGIPSIDTDRVYHELLIPPSECLDELVGAFGKEILNAEGYLDRPTLSKIVFSDPTREKQLLLNRITHKYVLSRTSDMIDRYRCDEISAVLVDAPLLYESGFDGKCDAVIAVLAPVEVRKQRIMARDGLSEERADARLNMQKTDDFYTSRARYVIINDNDLSALHSRISEIVSDLGVVCS
jgi:dephospho-CoA kinase